MDMITYILFIAFLTLVILVSYIFILKRQRLPQQQHLQDNFAASSQNLVVVTSVINTIQDRLKYGEHKDHTVTRSIFSSDERLEQTVKTIESVKLKIPSAFIVVVDGSQDDLGRGITERLLGAGCDYVYRPDRLDIVNGTNKSLGEITLILDFLDSTYFKKLVTVNALATFNKISGRYFLTDAFDFSRYPIDSAVYKSNYIRKETRYYRIPMADIEIYKERLVQGSRDPAILNVSKDIETFDIFIGLPNVSPVVNPDMLGVSGFIAVRNEFVEDFGVFAD